LWKRCKTIIDSIAENVLGIMEPIDIGTWFDNECQAATADKNKAYRKMQQGYQNLNRRVQRKEKKRKQFIKERKNNG
jgi:hypothetical protein